MVVATWLRAIGLALILIGIGWCVFWWASARDLTPLDTRISLSKAHIRSPEFEIKTPRAYNITLLVRGRSGYYDYLIDRGASWSVSRRGVVIARGTRQSWYALGQFEAGPGRYALDVYLSPEGSRYAASSARLIVRESGGLWEVADAQQSQALGGSLVLATLAIGMILASAFLRKSLKAERLRDSWRLSLPWSQLPEGTVGARRGKPIVAPKVPVKTDYLVGDPRTVARRPLTGLSSASLLVALVFFILLVAAWSTSSLTLTPVGLKVRLFRPALAKQTNHGLQPVLVQVRNQAPPNLYINGRLVSRDDFEALLHTELVVRPLHWPVYVEGDRDLFWRDVAEVVDIIQGQQAQAVLLGSWRSEDTVGKPR